METPTVLFAGLGAMGYGMATHLLRSGFPVVGYDVHPPSMHRLVAAGGTSALTPRAAAAGVDLMLVMVADHTQATALLFDARTGAVQGLRTGATVLLCSTVSPRYVAEVAARLRAVGRPDVRLVDAPVSGGKRRAAEGSLSVFAAAEHEVLFAPLVRLVLGCLCPGGKLYHVPGGLGAGSKAKLIHQIFAGVNIAVASEAMGLAAAAGLDTKVVLDEVCAGPGASWMFGNRVPFMLEPGLGRYSATSIIAKDVGIVLATAGEERFPLPLVAAAGQVYASAIARGWGCEDDCVVVRLYLPGSPNLVVERAGKPRADAASDGVCAGDVRDLLVGVHLAAVSEAMRFCDVLGVEADLMFDIVSNAAGASRVFEHYFRGMRERGWALKGVEGVEDVRDSLSTAVAKAREMHFPLFLASAALQEFQRQLW